MPSSTNGTSWLLRKESASDNTEPIQKCNALVVLASLVKNKILHLPPLFKEVNAALGFSFHFPRPGSVFEKQQGIMFVHASSSNSHQINS